MNQLLAMQSVHDHDKDYIVETEAIEKIRDFDNIIQYYGYFNYEVSYLFQNII